MSLSHRTFKVTTKKGLTFSRSWLYQFYMKNIQAKSKQQTLLPPPPPPPPPKPLQIITALPPYYLGGREVVELLCGATLQIRHVHEQATSTTPFRPLSSLQGSEAGTHSRSRGACLVPVLPELSTIVLLQDGRCLGRNQPLRSPSPTSKLTSQFGAKLHSFNSL